MCFFMPLQAMRFLGVVLATMAGHEFDRMERNRQSCMTFMCLGSQVRCKLACTRAHSLDQTTPDTRCVKLGMGGKAAKMNEKIKN